MDYEDRIDELNERLQGMMQVPTDLVQLIAACAKVCGPLIEADSDEDMPHTWLAWNWHSIMQILPRCQTPAQSEKAFRSLRCIALCMHATGFPESQSFLAASEGMLSTVLSINKLEAELNSIGETKQ